MTWGPPIWLASASPRRRQLLSEAGIDHRVQPPSVDDGCLRPGRRTAGAWTMAMAWLKAQSAARELRAAGHRVGTVLAADTVCAASGEILGQPVDLTHARSMMTSLVNATHHTVSGVCLLCLATGERLLFFDQTMVTVGVVDDERIDAYLASGQWQGKAGGYNLADRLTEGWPIVCDGDPSTVMGLPLRRLGPLLSRSSRGKASDGGAHERT